MSEFEEKRRNREGESLSKGKEMAMNVECPAGSEVTPLARMGSRTQVVRS